MKYQINQIVEHLQTNLTIVKNPSLLYGNTGLCIFFNHLYRNTRKADYDIIASDLLEKVFDSVNDSVQHDFENGLAGIGWGLEYMLYNRFVEGDPDDILEDFDDRIFKYLNSNNLTSFELTTGLTGYLFYFINRLRNDNKTQSYTRKINYYVLIFIINKLDELVTAQFHTIVKDKYFDLLWRFPLMLYGLIEAFKLGLYCHKISSMIKQWIPYFEAYIPSININRLYLAVVLMKIVKIIKENRLEKQIQILLFGMDFNLLLSELDPRIINSRYGLPGLAIILEQAVKILPPGFPNYLELKTLYQYIIEKSASELNEYIFNLKPNLRELGLIEGLSGIGLYRLGNFVNK